MNIIGLCQGANLKIFSELVRLIDSDLSLNKIGVFVADADYYQNSREVKSFSKRTQIVWLKEWESVKEGLGRKPDRALIKKFENELGAPGLWNSVLADRRLQFGRYCKSIQHYRPRYTENQLLGVLSEALLRVETFFEEVQPDIVFGFVPVTLHEYLILRIAEARGVKIRLLRSTKIENYISLNDRLFGLSGHINEKMVSEHEEFEPETYAVVDRYLNHTSQNGAVYEGMHLPSFAYRRSKLSVMVRVIAVSVWNEIRRLLNRTIKEDNHNPGYLIPALIEQVFLPLRAYRARKFIKKTNKKNLDIVESEYCLFPLHFEPEIALQIYARPLQNQIEVARNIALSLPAGMKLVVKEHPRSSGHRPLSYYRKLLDIPNVVLAEPEVSSFELIRAARIVVVITGNMGLEAAVLKKPVVVLGEADYSELPSCMLRTCHNLYKLSEDISSLMKNYNYDGESLRRYLLATVSGSVSVDLYSTLLGKKGRHSFSSGGFDEDLKRLRVYINERLSIS